MWLYVYHRPSMWMCFALESWINCPPQLQQTCSAWWKFSSLPWHSIWSPGCPNVKGNRKHLGTTPDCSWFLACVAEFPTSFGQHASLPSSKYPASFPKTTNSAKHRTIRSKVPGAKVASSDHSNKHGAVLAPQGEKSTNQTRRRGGMSTYTSMAKRLNGKQPRTWHLGKLA